MKYPLDDENTYALWMVWTQPAMFAVADYWLKGVEDAEWNWNAGTSVINGVGYPASVYIKHEEDYLIFKLRFNELLKFK